MTDLFTLPPVIETPRMRIRPARLSDKPAHVAMWADPRVTTFIGGEPRSPEMSWGKLLSGIGMWPVLGFGYWVFADRDTDQLIGTGGLAFHNRGIAALEDVPEAGWAFGADHWGTGLATEVMRAIFDWADGALAVPEIRCIIDPGNDASARVAAKLGFSRMSSAPYGEREIDIYRRPQGQKGN